MKPLAIIVIVILCAVLSLGILLTGWYFTEKTGSVWPLGIVAGVETFLVFILSSVITIGCYRRRSRRSDQHKDGIKIGSASWLSIFSVTVLLGSSILILPTPATAWVAVPSVVAQTSSSVGNTEVEVLAVQMVPSTDTSLIPDVKSYTFTSYTNSLCGDVIIPCAVLPLWCVMILVVVIIIVAGVVIYVVYRICKILDRLPTNSPPSDISSLLKLNSKLASSTGQTERSVQLEMEIGSTNGAFASPYFPGSMPTIRFALECSTNNTSWATEYFFDTSITNSVASVVVYDKQNRPIMTNDSITSTTSWNAGRECRVYSSPTPIVSTNSAPARFFKLRSY